ncbi:MAG: hypothetical protein CMJ64_17815 [Planctomycetaceae bacterium]|nr:hypothetical protein [Planctomycetaceae bacterium]
MTSRLTGILLFALAPLVGLAVTYGLRAQDDAASPEQRLRTLLEERRDTLSERLDALENMREVGLGDADVVVSARIDVLDAELELAATKAERIEVLKKRLRSFRELEDWARHSRRLLHAHRARTTRTAVDAAGDMLLAKAARMQDEIDLLREEMTKE